MNMENKAHHPLIRTIYLYIFTLLGLALLTIGGVRFVDMGLKAFIFTQAEEEQRAYYKQPPYPPIRVEKIAEVDAKGNILSKKNSDIKLSEEERAILDQWSAEYKNWQDNRVEVDPLTARRHRDASLNLALILIGLPLYFYHWRIIGRETKNKS